MKTSRKAAIEMRDTLLIKGESMGIFIDAFMQDILDWAQATSEYEEKVGINRDIAFGIVTGMMVANRHQKIEADDGPDTSLVEAHLVSLGMDYSTWQKIYPEKLPLLNKNMYVG